MLLHKALQVEHVCTPHCGAAQALRRHMDGPVLLLGLLRLWRKNKAQQGSRTQVLLWCDRIQVGGFPSAPAWPPPSVVTYSCLKLLLEAAGRDVWYQPIGSLLGGTPAARRGPHPAAALVDSIHKACQNRLLFTCSSGRYTSGTMRPFRSAMPSSSESTSACSLMLSPARPWRRARWRRMACVCTRSTSPSK